MNHSLPRVNAVMADHYLTTGKEQDAYKLFQRLVGTSIAQPRDYAALEYFDRQLPENERPTRPYEHTTDYALEKYVKCQYTSAKKYLYSIAPSVVSLQI